MQFTVFLFLTASILSQTPPTPTARELFADPGFTRGFMLTAASHPGPKVEIGVLQTLAEAASAAPAWRMPQWGTRDVLQPQRCVDAPSGLCLAENGAKRVQVDRSAPGSTGLWLEVHGGCEYEGRMRAAGEPWPHLLIEQVFDKPLVPREYRRILFSMQGAIPFCKAAAWSEGKLSPGLHTAQVSAFWTVHNVTPGHPECGDMIWFGIPFFDARHPIPPAHYALDAGKADASGKFICLLDGKRFWKNPTGDGAPQSLEVDLLPLLREALTITQEHGYLKSTRFEDLSIDSFNLGWEIPGPYDAAFQVRGLSLRGEAR
jgi:hypothetical protein